MSVTLDRFGFPYLRLKSGGAVGLFPLLKVQFEFLYGRVGGTSLIDYTGCLSINARGSWRQARTMPHLDTLFLTGVTAMEAERIALAFGERKVTTAEQWREADANLDIPFSHEACEKLLKLPTLHPACAAILRRPGARTWRDFGVGYLEWVTTPMGAGLYGDPRTDFGLNWLSNRKNLMPMIPRSEQRHRCHTFRLFWTGAHEGRTS